MELVIKIDVKDKLEAFKLVNKLSYEHGIFEVLFDGLLRKYDKANPIRWFLKEKLLEQKVASKKLTINEQ